VRILPRRPISPLNRSAAGLWMFLFDMP
jgi:hypothetical protein